MESTKTNARFAKNPDVAAGTAKFREASRAVLQEVINCKKDLKVLQKKLSKIRVEAATTLAGFATLHDPYMRHQLVIAYQNQELLLATMQKQESSGVDNSIENTHSQEENEEMCQENKDGDNVENSSSNNNLQNCEVIVSLDGESAKDASSTGVELQINSVGEQLEDKEITSNLDMLPEEDQAEASFSQETMDAAMADVSGKEPSPEVSGYDLMEMSPYQEEVGNNVSGLEMIAGYAEIFKSPN